MSNGNQSLPTSTPALDKKVSKELLQLETKSNTKAPSPFLFSPTSAAAQAQSQASSSPSGITERKTFRVAPPSDLLSRVAAFLPQLQQANVKLQQDIAVHGADAFSVENVEDEEAQHVEMDVAVGVLEAQSDIDSDDEIVIPTEQEIQAHAKQQTATPQLLQSSGKQKKKAANDTGKKMVEEVEEKHVDS